MNRVGCSLLRSKCAPPNPSTPAELVVSHARHRSTKASSLPAVTNHIAEAWSVDIITLPPRWVLWTHDSMPTRSVAHRRSVLPTIGRATTRLTRPVPGSLATVGRATRIRLVYSRWHEHRSG